MTLKELEEPELPKRMIKNRIDPLDLYILNKLHDKAYGWEERKDLTPEEGKYLEEKRAKPWMREGASVTTLDRVIKKELNIDITRSEVERRIEKLANDRVLLSLHSIIVDPTKLFDHVAHIYLKIPVSSPVLRTGGLTWWEALEKIWTIDKTPEFKGESPTDIIRLGGVIEGTGDYDLILLIYANDMEKVSRFLHKLAKAGYIEKSMTQRIWIPTGIKFEPVAIPEAETYARAVSTYSEILENMRKLRE